MTDIREKVARAIWTDVHRSNGNGPDEYMRKCADAALSACGHAELVEALEEAEDALDNYADGEYYEGVPRGNAAMNALMTVRTALAKARGET